MTWWVQSVSGYLSMDWAKGRKGKEEASSTFVLPPITSICTYNVGAVRMLSECTQLFVWRLYSAACNNCPSPFVFECGMLHLSTKWRVSIEGITQQQFSIRLMIFVFFFWSTQQQTRPNQPCCIIPQVKLMAEAWQEFHLHSNQGLNPGPFLSSPGPRMSYTIEPSPPLDFDDANGTARKCG